MQVEVPLLPEGIESSDSRKHGRRGATPSSSTSKDGAGDTQTQSQDVEDAAAPSYVDKDSKIFDRFDFSFIEEYTGRAEDEVIAEIEDMIQRLGDLLSKSEVLHTADYDYLGNFCCLGALI